MHWTCDRICYLTNLPILLPALADLGLCIVFEHATLQVRPAQRSQSQTHLRYIILQLQECRIYLDPLSPNHSSCSAPDLQTTPQLLAVHSVLYKVVKGGLPTSCTRPPIAAADPAVYFKRNDASPPECATKPILTCVSTASRISPDAVSAIHIARRIRLCSSRPSSAAYCSALDSMHTPRASTPPCYTRLPKHQATARIPACASPRCSLQQRSRSRLRAGGCGFNHVFGPRTRRASQASRLQHIP